MPKGCYRVLDRLRRGHVWLTEQHSALLAMPNIGLRTTEDRQFMAALSLWGDLERFLRWVYEYQGCVTAEGHCPEGSPVNCSACGDDPRR